MGSSAIANHAVNRFMSVNLAGQSARTSFNEQANLLLTETAVQNAGGYSADTPLLVAVDHVSDPIVRVRGQTGATPAGLPFFDYSHLVASGRLDPAEVTTAQTLSFFNPGRNRFDFDLALSGRLNRAPAFLSAQRPRSLVDQSHPYDVDATDPDADPLSYQLLAGPADMTIDANTGVVGWMPASNDVGLHDERLQVTDGRGGVGEQRFVLAASTPATNLLWPYRDPQEYGLRRERLRP